MAKTPSISSLRSKEWSLAAKIKTLSESYTRRKRHLFAEKERLEALRDEIMQLRVEHQELREEIKDIEGY
tara:strand:- start:1558 stop:1767 length:210 start_codon:yes stop_codon:yes gene_type:complete